MTLSKKGTGWTYLEKNTKKEIETKAGLSKRQKYILDKLGKQDDQENKNKGGE